MKSKKGLIIIAAVILIGIFGIEEILIRVKIYGILSPETIMFVILYPVQLVIGIGIILVIGLFLYRLIRQIFG